MAEVTQFLIEHGYMVIFLWVALDQAGLPLPAVPLLLAAGTLAGMGDLNLALILLTCVLAAVPIDFFWFLFGRAQGAKVLNLLCSISLEPDYCVRNTQEVFQRLGNASLLVAKFVPGLQTLAPPMSGVTGMSAVTFLILDTLGTLLWAALFVVVGFWFHTEIEQLATRFAELGTAAGVVVLGIIAAWLGWKLINRKLFLRSLEMRKLHPQQVFERLRDEDFHVIDLRHASDVAQQPVRIPGAVRVPMEAIDRHYQNIPPDSNIALYCS